MSAGQVIRMTIVCLAFSTTSYAGLWYKIPSSQDEIQEFGFAPAQELNPNKINVMVWNQYKGKNSSWRSEYTRLSKNQDVLILQEASIDKKMVKAYASNRNQYTIFAASFVYRWKNRATGVASSANVPASSYIAQRSRGVEIAGGTPKMILFATYPLAGRQEELMTVNIHALNSVTWQTLAVQILDALRIVKEHHGPVVFGGDFNTWSKAKMNYLKHAMQKAGMEEVHFAHSERKMKVFGRELDHVFTRGVNISDAVVEKTGGSDHQPLFLTLQVR